MSGNGNGNSDDFKKERRRKAASANSNCVDRLPPFSLEAEQGLLGCQLLSPLDCVGFFIEKSDDASHGVYFDLRHQTIQRAMIEMMQAQVAIDIITLQQWLKDRELLEQIGGIPYLNSLQDAVPSSANIAYYTEIVLEKHMLRRGIAVCTEFVGRAYDHSGNVEKLLDEGERDFLRIRRTKTENQRDTKALVQRAIDTIERHWKRGEGTSGISTGFLDLDKMTDGLHGGNMVVIAARTSQGKTSLAMNIAEHVSMVEKKPVGVFSLEMTADELMLRSVCSLARVNLRNIKEGFMSERDFPLITAAAGKLAKAPLYIDDSPGLSIMQLRARARRLWQQHGINLFIVDYLQLLHSTSGKSENRSQEIADISGGIKAMAKEFNVPVIAVAQLNRDVERERRRPKLSDLRESGSIEQDADLVGLLYRPKAESDDPVDAPDVCPMNLLIAKQRNGPTGDVNFTFLKSYTRFEDAARGSEADVPPQQGEL